MTRAARTIPRNAEAVEMNIGFLLKAIIQKINRKCGTVVIAGCSFMLFSGATNAEARA